MEWLVPIVFIVVSLAQWWLKRRQAQPEEVSPPLEEQIPQQSSSPRPSQPRPSPEPMNDFGDLLEALGRRRHESPPPLAPIPKAQTTAPPQILPPLITAFESPAPSPLSAQRGSSALTRAFPKSFLSTPPQTVTEDVYCPTHRWSKRLRNGAALQEAFVLSEILAPPISLR